MAYELLTMWQNLGKNTSVICIIYVVYDVDGDVALIVCPPHSYVAQDKTSSECIELK